MESLIIDKQKRLNEEVAQILKASKSSITNLRLISLGNSIASGYSMVRTVKPLLLRNGSIENIMKEYDIELERYHFARAQNNNDEHIFEWLASNITENEMYKMNRSDYSGSATSMVVHGLTPANIDEYYPKKEADMNKGLRDLALDNNSNTANIIIYNGCTGSFLDAITRNGKLTQQLMHGVNRDTVGLESVLKYIQTNNRINQANTQVYVCGAPNFLGLRISELINGKIKKTIKNYANVSYVEPVKSKFFYKPIEEINEEELTALQAFFKRNMRQVDIHYDEEEYLKFNNNIMNAIKNDYEINDSMINIDRDMYKLNHILEINNPALIGDELVLDITSTIIEKEKDKQSSQDKKDRLLKRSNKYLTNRSPYDYFYVGKKTINKTFQKK